MSEAWAHATDMEIIAAARTSTLHSFAVRGTETQAMVEFLIARALNKTKTAELVRFLGALSPGTISHCAEI